MMSFTVSSDLECRPWSSSLMRKRVLPNSLMSALSRFISARWSFIDLRFLSYTYTQHKHIKFLEFMMISSNHHRAWCAAASLTASVSLTLSERHTSLSFCSHRRNSGDLTTLKLARVCEMPLTPPPPPPPPPPLAPAAAAYDEADEADEANVTDEAACGELKPLLACACCECCCCCCWRDVWLGVSVTAAAATAAAKEVLAGLRAPPATAFEAADDDNNDDDDNDDECTTLCLFIESVLARGVCVCVGLPGSRQLLASASASWIWRFYSRDVCKFLSLSRARACFFSPPDTKQKKSDCNGARRVLATFSFCC